MKSYFVFVRDLGRFKPDSVVYSVSVGESEREQIKLALIKEYCKNCGLYFRQRSDRTDKTIDNLAKSLFKGSAFPRLHIRSIQVSISQLYHLIIDDSFDSLEKRYSAPKGLFRLITLIDPKPIFSPKFRITKQSACPSSRKYLKSEGRQDIYTAIIGFGLILITYVVASMICSTEIY